MRRANWVEIIDKEIESSSEKDFSWGKCDCCLWVADVVREMTGIDYAKLFRGKYKTQKGAATALRKFGSGKIINSIPLKAIGVAYAGRGDVVLATLSTGPALGMCLGVHSAFKADGKGLLYLTTLSCDKAWRVD